MFLKISSNIVSESTACDEGKMEHRHEKLDTGDSSQKMEICSFSTFQLTSTTYLNRTVHEHCSVPPCLVIVKALCDKRFFDIRYYAMYLNVVYKWSPAIKGMRSVVSDGHQNVLSNPFYPERCSENKAWMIRGGLSHVDTLPNTEYFTLAHAFDFCGSVRQASTTSRSHRHWPFLRTSWARWALFHCSALLLSEWVPDVTL